MNRFVMFVMAIALSFVGCTKVQRYENPSPNHVATVRVWIERDKHLPPEHVLAGCELWKDKGIRCVQVPNKEQASIRVNAIFRNCATDPDGLTTLAYADPGGGVFVVVDCFTDDKNQLNEKKFRAVLGHEIGHQFGIWKHVPKKCEKNHVICGDALMNPYYQETIDFITPVDSLAFDARELQRAVVSYDGEEPTFNMPQNHEVDGCTYTTRVSAPQERPLVMPQ